jgi:hypothetical protein
MQVYIYMVGTFKILQLITYIYIYIYIYNILPLFHFYSGKYINIACKYLQIMIFFSLSLSLSIAASAFSFAFSLLFFINYYHFNYSIKE